MNSGDSGRAAHFAPALFQGQRDSVPDRRERQRASVRRGAVLRARGRGLLARDTRHGAQGY